MHIHWINNNFDILRSILVNLKSDIYILTIIGWVGLGILVVKLLILVLQIEIVVY